MSEEKVYMYISTLKFFKEFWNENEYDIKVKLVSKLKELEEFFSDKLISIKYYYSLRHNCDIIFWVSSFDTNTLIKFRITMNKLFSEIGEENYSLLSIYKQSPYFKAKHNLAEYLKLKPLRYFVAYPMKKSPEWYLLPFSDRDEMMSEHITTAMNHPKAKGIRSYTTYSFGITEDEFVVIYELTSLDNWVEVVEKLREVKARKWTLREEPVLIGERIEFNNVF